MTNILSKLLTTLTALVLVLALQASITALPPLAQLAQAAAPTNGLVGYWAFDEGSGTTAADSSGQGNNGTLVNGPSWTTGKVGSGALSFDGVDDEVNMDNLTSFDFSQENAFTISAWVYPDDTSPADTVFSRGATFSSANGEIFFLSKHNIDGTYWRARVSDGVNEITASSIAGTVTANVWQHMTLVWDGTTLTIYKNGISIATGVNENFTGLWNGDSATDRETSIGAEGAGERRYWDGTIDEVRIYNRALSVSEILDVYNDSGGVPPPSPPPDTTPPTASITYPTAGATVSGSAVSITASASDNVGVAGVQFLLDGSNLGTEDTLAPYSYSWDTTSTSNGSHTLTAVARDSAGNQTTSASITVTVNNLSSDTIPPSVPSGLLATAVSSSQINLSWTASTDNVGVTGYRIYRGGFQIGTSATNNYNDTGLSASTQYSYTVSAYDAANNASAQSASASATTQAAVVIPPSGTTFYIRDGATGTTCTDWTNACDTLPASLQRGATYYIADGTYPSYTFDDPVSGTQLITIKKAIISDHGTNTGWSDTYGDGQAVFSGGTTMWRFTTGYWVLDGQTGSGTSGHGFLIEMTSLTAQNVYGIHLDGEAASNITLKHFEIYHTNACGAEANLANQSLIRSAGTGADNVTISYAYLHDSPVNLIIAVNADNWTVENSWLESPHSNSTNHGQSIYHGLQSARGWIIRNNMFKNPNGSAVVFFYGTVVDTLIYGNVIWEEAASACGNYSVAAIVNHNPGSSITGITGLRFYNNTIVNLDGRGTASNIAIDLGSDNLVYNNLWYGTTPTFENSTGAFNDVNITDPSIFVNYTAGDFRLARATNAGTTLPALYNLDANGNTRGADGNWDRGAYEFVSGTPSPPPGSGAPTGDFNSDNLINTVDFSFLNRRWNFTTNISAFDMNGDGIINASDSALLLSKWFQGL